MDNVWEKLEALEERLERIGCTLSYGLSYKKNRSDGRNPWMAVFTLAFPTKTETRKIELDYAFTRRGLAMKWLFVKIDGYTSELESHFNGPTGNGASHENGQSTF